MNLDYLTVQNVCDQNELRLSNVIRLLCDQNELRLSNVTRLVCDPYELRSSNVIRLISNQYFYFYSRAAAASAAAAANDAPTSHTNHAFSAPTIRSFDSIGSKFGPQGSDGDDITIDSMAMSEA